MNRYLFTFLCFAFAHLVAHAQEPAQDKIELISTYIEEVIDQVNFVPETTTGVTTTAEGKSVDYSLSYYAMDEKELFTVVYAQFDTTSTNKIFTYKDGEVVRVAMEKISHQKENDRVVFQAMYFYDHGQLLNPNDEQEGYSSSQALEEGKTYLNTFLKL